MRKGRRGKKREVKLLGGGGGTKIRRGLKKVQSEENLFPKKVMVKRRENVRKRFHDWFRGNG